MFRKSNTISHDQEAANLCSLQTFMDAFLVRVDNRLSASAEIEPV